MRKINYILLPVIGLIIMFIAQELYASGFARTKYNAAIGYIKKGQPDFALMEFRSLLREFPKSPFAQKSLFAIAEYYYDHGMYEDAIEKFTWCAKDGSDLEANVIAKVYLLKIIKEIENPAPEEKELLEGIKKELSSKSAFLIFSEYKKTCYRSASLNKFKIIHHIDSIDVHRNDQLFVTIIQ
jgi:predicted negative regulator of RcsB-dependent stress response